MRPIEVAVIGGGCAAMATAFELSRPEHGGRYRVTVYQQGWRLGGKGASGRGPSARIEEHGLHVWMGFYENAFRLLRECYAELADGDDRAGAPPRRFGHWRDAFVPDPYIGVAEAAGDGAWHSWLAYFPPTSGSPGDPIDATRSFTVAGYLRRCVELLGMILRDVYVQRSAPEGVPAPPGGAPLTIGQQVDRLLAYGRLATLAGLSEAAGLLAQAFAGPAGAFAPAPVLRLLDEIAARTRAQIEGVVATDDQLRRRWYVVDLLLATLRGIVAHGLAFDPRGFDAINDFEFRAWLRQHGASAATLRSGMLRGALYDLTFAYRDGDPAQPAFAAGDALRCALRTFFTYRGAFFWKMRAGMGDVVFAPFYEVLRRRGVRFCFFHRLDNVRIADGGPGGRPHVEALDLSIQAELVAGDPTAYRPLVDVRGVPSWPAAPDHDQLVDGDRLRRDGVDFESFWDRRAVATRTLRVGADFDLVVLGVGLGAIPHVASELVARDPRWRRMTEQVTTVATQAFQLWLRADLAELGWRAPTCSVSGFAKPFDTWADMPQLLDAEEWRDPPRSIAYFCGALAAASTPPADAGYPAEQRERTRRAAIAFLERDLRHLWPLAVRPDGGFRWELLACDGPNAATGADRFATQFWTANVNPSDRYVQTLPGSSAHRISPLDYSFDNLTVCGDWTACGLNAGCVEAAVMSGRLAAHAISALPRLEEIVGYDHP